MKKEGLNLFISISPSHISSFESLISQNKELNKSNILINAGNYVFNKKYWDDVIIGEKDLRAPSDKIINKLSFQREKILFYKKLIFEINKKLPKSTDISLYYCNLEDILNNYYFFNFKKEAVKRRILVEDGILNYYSYKISKERYLTFLIKFIWCKILGVKYKLVFGQLSGIDRDEVSTQYVKYPKFAIFPEKALELKVEKLNYSPLKNVVLFVGQDVLEDVLGHKNYNIELVKILNKTQEILPVDSKFVYKPHRNGNYKIAENRIKELINVPFEILEDNTPVEKLIVDIRPSIIISFFSTSLLNLKLNINNSVKVYFMPLEVTDKRIIDLFEEVGIVNLTNL